MKMIQTLNNQYIKNNTVLCFKQNNVYEVYFLKIWQKIMGCDLNSILFRNHGNYGSTHIAY